MQPNSKALYVIDKGPHTDGYQLCLHLTTKHTEGYLCFHDTNRGHMIKGEIKEEQENGFTFEDRKGCIWEFREVTVQEFRHHLHKAAYNGEEITKLCSTTDDLWEYFRKAFPI